MNELTANELLEIVNQDGRSISTLHDDKSNVKDYIKEREVRDGITLVPNFYLYYHYHKVWNPTGKKLSKIGFLRKMNVVFEQKRTKKVRYYLLDQESFDLSEETISEAKRFDERYRRKVAKKSEQKKQAKISRIEQKVQP